MLKYILYILVGIVIIGLIAGGIHLWQVNRKNAKEMAPYDGEPVAVTKDLGRVLVVYYSLSGHTKDIAERIAAKTNGDLYEIKTKEKLNNTPWYYLTLRNQIKNKEYPELEGKLPDMSKYDTVFIGAPVWWYTLATPLSSFLKQVDFEDKVIAPFSTQGSNYGSFFKDFAAQSKNGILNRMASFNNLPDKYDAQVDNKIAVWLNSL